MIQVLTRATFLSIYCNRRKAIKQSDTVRHGAHSQVSRIEFPVTRFCFVSNIDGLTGSFTYSLIFDVSIDCHLCSGAGKKITFQDKQWSLVFTYSRNSAVCKLVSHFLVHRPKIDYASMPFYACMSPTRH